MYCSGDSPRGIRAKLGGITGISLPNPKLRTLQHGGDNWTGLPSSSRGILGTINT